MDSANKYTAMQQRQYDAEASQWSTANRDPVVGSFDAHNAWADYNDYLFRDVGGELAEKVVLDFGCGPGRNLVKYKDWFKRIDGVDISQKNLDNAKIWISKNGGTPGNLYKNNGVDLSVVPDDTYDVVMSTICFQHICVYDIRKNYLKEMFRVLKPGGVLTVQMGFGGKPPKYQTSAYAANNFDALATNSGCDVSVMSPDDVSADLATIGYDGFCHYVRPVGPGDTHANWIFFSAKKPQQV